MNNITIINKKPYRLTVENEEYSSNCANEINVDQFLHLPQDKRHVIYYRDSAAVLLIGHNHEDVVIKENIDFTNSPIKDIHVINAEYKPSKGGLVVKRVQEIIFR